MPSWCPETGGPCKVADLYNTACSLKGRLTFSPLNADGRVSKLGFQSDYRIPLMHKLQAFPFTVVMHRYTSTMFCSL